MTNSNLVRSLERRCALVVGTVSIAVLVGACGSVSKTTTTSTTKPATTTVETRPSTSSSAPATSSTTTPAPSVAVYLVRAEKVSAVRRVGSQQDPLRSALESLLKGPSTTDAQQELTSAIPKGTRLLDVESVEGTATVDLSNEFGSGGGSLSMTERIAQVVYTATQFPTVTGVLFKIDGKPVTELGGEGVVIDTAQSRTDWEAMAPAILLESPYPGDVLANPVLVRGSANVFEATFRVRIKDASGTVLVDEMVMATSGSGTRGSFDEQIAYRITTPGPGTLIVYENSARDGSEINVITIRVTLG